MIRMTKAVYDDIVDHARQDAPVEACGYLGDKEGVISTCYRMKNRDISAEHFSLDPAEQFSVVRDMRKNGEKPAAVYHSHPVTPARFSEEDKRLAIDPGISYVIVSLKDDCVKVKSFLIKNSRIEPEEIEVVVI